jgi:hypothetical protein
MEPAELHVPLVGSYRSVVVGYPPLKIPPTTRTLPFARAVAEWA